MQECVCCAVLAKALFNVLSWSGKQEGALLFCCSVTNHWSRAVFPYSFPLVSLPALVRGLPHVFWFIGSGSNRARDCILSLGRSSSPAELAIPVCDTCDRLCVASTETQHDILHPLHDKITSWLGDTRRNRQDETSQKNDISRSPKACLLIYADKYLQKFPCIQPRRSCCF